MLTNFGSLNYWLEVAFMKYNNNNNHNHDSVPLMDIDGLIFVRRILFIRSLRISPFFPLNLPYLGRFLLGIF